MKDLDNVSYNSDNYLMFDFRDSQGYKRTLVIKPNEYLALHTESGSVRFDKDMASELVERLQEFINTGTISV